MVKKGAERRTEDGKRWAPELTLIYISILILMGHALTMVVICTLIHLLSLISHFSASTIHSFCQHNKQPSFIHPYPLCVLASLESFLCHGGKFSHHHRAVLLLWGRVVSSVWRGKVEGGDERMCGMKSKKTTFTQKFKNVWVKNSLHFLRSLSFRMLVHSLNLDLLRVHIKWTFSPFPSLNSCSFR